MTHCLVADIGGTNARFAIADEKTFLLTNVETFSSNQFPEFHQVVSQYLAKLPKDRLPKKACFAVASPVTGDLVKFTNNPWLFSKTELKDRFQFNELRVINDFEAIALSMPFLKNHELVQIGSGSLQAELPLAVLGPGTGLGMALLVPLQEGLMPVATEGGHSSFAPSDAYEIEILKVLTKKFSFVSKEDLLSGSGLVNLYQAITEIEGQNHVLSPKPHEITKLALERRDPLSEKTLDYFCAILGSTAGDLALQSGARGGVFIAGGIVPRFQQYFVNSRFREKFEAKGSYRNYLERIPSFLIIAPQPGLIGATAAFRCQGDKT